VKVAFDSRARSSADGVGRYSRCILRALAETGSAGDELLESARPAATVRARNLDVFHSPSIEGAMLHSPCAMVVTVHDVAALKRRSEHLRSGVRLRMRHLAVQRAAGVIVPSETVARDAVEHLGLERERISVIPHAPDPAMRPRSEPERQRVREQLGVPERYLVWAGDLQHPASGRHLAKLAATARELPLVLVGPTRPWAHELPGVLLTGRVNDEQLAALYSGADALVLPFEDAGCGLGAVEALACGTAVVACDQPGLRGLLDGRASFVEPGDLGSLVAAAQGAPRPAPGPPHFTWRDAGRATWRAYAQALSALAAPRAARVARRRPASGLGAQ
jgi:glycosyltransferase involved in cell wall biosynthesis